MVKTTLLLFTLFSVGITFKVSGNSNHTAPTKRVFKSLIDVSNSVITPDNNHCETRTPSLTVSDYLVEYLEASSSTQANMFTTMTCKLNEDYSTCSLRYGATASDQSKFAYERILKFEYRTDSKENPITYLQCIDVP